jgi:arylsulfatase
MHARPRDIAKYKGVYDQGWDAIRAARHRRMVQLGIVDANWPLSPRDSEAHPWKDEELKEWNSRCMEVYAAMVDCLDQGVGRIVVALRETGHAENTLVIFLSDNGGSSAELGRSEPLPVDPSQIRSMAAGELQRRRIPICTRDGRPVRLGAGVMPGPPDTYIAYGLPWANVSNTPFRRFKRWVHEGGISTPFIAHWPRGLSHDRKGQLEHQLAHVVDLMATFVDLARAEYPRKVGNRETIPLQGVSLRPVFNGQRVRRRRPLYWEHRGNRAVRFGRWKLVAEGVGGPWELYDMEADRCELDNLANQYPKRVGLLAAAWEAWAIEARVKPWPHGRKR